ncbi:hypothetical protein ACFPJ1_21245 [Kribbella qitaiheensis]|uniref:Mom family adenine methylcarbamoylation protein n=1 Tax=Kribbella qitaiheensis TaxID=1544730 RepID=UPI00360FC157
MVSTPPQQKASVARPVGSPAAPLAAVPVRSATVSLDDCRGHDSEFAELAREAAELNNVEPRALIVRTLLHLPRVARRDGQLRWQQIKTELARCAIELRTDQAKVADLVPHATFKLQELLFVEYDERLAEQIFGHLHYLRSARPGSLNYALVDPRYGQPVSLCSVSPLEWKRVGGQITRQFDVPMSAIWDISRVYSFAVAPPNAISYLLSKVRTAIRHAAPQVELLSTAVDPNLGFTGSSYLAANWHRWMTIKPRPYLYFDRGYMSPRQLRAAFQTTNVAELRATFDTRFEQSQATLLDSMIFCCRTRGETENVPEGLQRRLHR